MGLPGWWAVGGKGPDIYRGLGSHRTPPALLGGGDRGEEWGRMAGERDTAYGEGGRK